MSYFRALIEFTEPSAADVGGMVAPEIYAVSHYPAMPQPGDKVTVKAKVASYYSMAPYKIAKVTLTFRRNNGPKQTVVMNLEYPEHGIYTAVLPAAREGDEVSYTVRAVDDWGNTAVELPPDSQPQILVQDDEDKALHPAADIRKIEASWDALRLKLCMEQRGKLEKTAGRELVVYGIPIFDRDVRYKPDQTESEFGGALMAAYAPGLNIKDIVRVTALLEAAAGKKGDTEAEFSKDNNRFCFAFAPENIRADYAAGLKLSGATVTGDLATMTLKPKDSTRMVMLYPGDHSFRVYSLK